MPQTKRQTDEGPVPVEVVVRAPVGLMLACDQGKRQRLTLSTMILCHCTVQMNMGVTKNPEWRRRGVCSECWAAGDCQRDWAMLVGWEEL